MKNLAILIDQLPSPDFPAYFSDEDQRKVLLALASAKNLCRPYDGNFQAPWLLNSFDAPSWDTTNGGREELVDGIWQNCICIDWRIQLPDKTLLTDAQNEKLLTLAKKISFLVRSDLISGTSAPGGWKTNITILISLIRWVVLHKQRFQPDKFGLRLFDQPAIDWLFSSIAQGGWSHTLQIPERILGALYIAANGVPCPQHLLDNPYSLSASEIGGLVSWLESQNAYQTIDRGPHFGKRHLRREFLSQMIGEDHSAVTGSNILRFARQFEIDFSNETLLVSIQQTTEFPSQKIRSRDNVDGAAADGTIKKAADVMSTILDAYRHLPELLPDPSNISIRSALNLAQRIAKPSGHTQFMPINIGLTYLNVAMRFVHLYGEAIVDFYLDILNEYGNRDPANANALLNRALKRRKDKWRIASGEPIAAVLKITKFRSTKSNPNFDQLRTNPTLDEALKILVGACIVCIAILKPSREYELTHLKRDCLREDNGGYWINFKVGKSNAKGAEAWQETDRPVPVITAKAIHLLQRLGEGLSTIFAENRKIGSNLFYLPKSNGFGALNANPGLLGRHLDIFCDFVGLPPDLQGRRWYVRIHEMRKWFLLLLFWSGRFDVLDAARWIAGHTDAEHIYAYIEREFPGEELPQIEADYSIDRVYQYEQERKRRPTERADEHGIDCLYEKVLNHFNVEYLTMVPESEWTDYIRTLRKDEQFHLEPHSIYADNGHDVIGINVSFVMREGT